MSKIHEDCGVFGIYTARDSQINPAEDTYAALFALQHRGQESCGIAVSDRGKFRLYKNVGLVSEVFNDEILASLKGQMAVGHCRYASRDVCDREHALPIVVEHVKGNLAVSHNGAIVNAQALREELQESGAIFQTKGDAELIATLIARERVHCGSIQEALVKLMDIMTGAYSLVVMSSRKLIAARDRCGYRPLCIGRIGESWVFASESVALDAVGATFFRDVNPGEVVWIEDGVLHSRQSDNPHQKKALCSFEYVYFARPDSIIDGMSVDRFRQKAGAILSEQFPVEADIVIGVPDSGLSAATGYTQKSGIPYGVGLIKNRYIGRTFIQPEQKKREQSVKLKLNVLADNIRGKRVVIVEDSIVRGTTTAHLIDMLRESGAAEVHMRVASPPFLYPCYFGTDIPNRSTLLAVGRTVEEIRTHIGADSLGFLPVEALHEIAREIHIDLCDGCFTGEYATDIPEFPRISKYEQQMTEEKRNG